MHSSAHTVPRGTDEPTPLASTDGHTTPDLYRRVLRYVQIPDHVTGSRRTRGSQIKAVARELAEYADWKTGAGAYPSIAMLALGAQVDHRTAQCAVAALVHYRLIGPTRAAGRAPNEYRLLNPMISGLTVLNPDQFREAAADLYDRAKGRRKQAQIEQPTGGESHPGEGRAAPTYGGEPCPPPPQEPSSTNTTDQVGKVSPDRAYAREDEPRIDVSEARRTRRRLTAVDPRHAKAIRRSRTERQAVPT